MSLDGCATGDRSPASSRIEASSPFAAVIVLLLAFYALFAPSGAALAAPRALSVVQGNQHAMQVSRAADSAASHPMVETIRRMPVPALRNADAFSALPATAQILAETLASTPPTVPQDIMTVKRGAAALVRAPPQVMDILV